MPEASPVFNRVNPSQLQDGPNTDQAQTHQWWWWHLWDKIFKKEGKGTKGKVWEKQPCRPQGQWRRRGRKCSRSQNRDFPCTLWKTPMLKQFMNNCSLWEGPTLDKFVKDCVPWEEPLARAAKEREEGVAETTWVELTAAPIPSPLASLEGEGRENREWNWVQKGVAEGVLRLGFISHYSTLIWLAIKYMNFPQVCFTHDSITGEWSLLVRRLTVRRLLLDFLCPAQLRRRGIGQLW